MCGDRGGEFRAQPIGREVLDGDEDEAGIAEVVAGELDAVSCSLPLPFSLPLPLPLPFSFSFLLTLGGLALDLPGGPFGWARGIQGKEKEKGKEKGKGKREGEGRGGYGKKPILKLAAVQ
jgi:hypothetical protein